MCCSGRDDVILRRRSRCSMGERQTLDISCNCLVERPCVGLCEVRRLPCLLPLLFLPALIVGSNSLLLDILAAQPWKRREVVMVVVVVVVVIVVNMDVRYWENLVRSRSG
ncbi:hypothetical protein LZ30DRAFT_232514 [Colletotrichum cereale]|nr:hypothetical protein LZ30DRAFT_232514 [Colletotrichum cereale]